MNFRKIVEAVSPSEFSYEIVVGYEKWINDYYRGNASICYQTLLSNCLRKCMANSVENLYVGVGI